MRKLIVLFLVVMLSMGFSACFLFQGTQSTPIVEFTNPLHSDPAVSDTPTPAVTTEPTMTATATLAVTATATLTATVPPITTFEEALALLKGTDTGDQFLVEMLQYEDLLGIGPSTITALDPGDQDRALTAIMVNLDAVTTQKGLIDLVNGSVASATTYSGIVSWVSGYPKGGVTLSLKTNHNAIAYYMILPKPGTGPTTAAMLVNWIDKAGEMPEDIQGIAITGDIQVGPVSSTIVTLPKLDQGETYVAYFCTRNGTKIGSFKTVTFKVP